MAHNTLLGDRDFSKPTIGFVKSVSDPLQNGRLKIFCPTIDFEDTAIEDLPWARYCTPFGGVISNYPSGPEGEISYGPNGYGLWAIPKIGAEVVVMFINGDPNLRVWTGCLFPTQTNRSLPAGRNTDDSGQPGPWTDSFEEYQPLKRNLQKAGLGSGTQYETRGKERAIAQAKTDKDGTDGYAKNPVSGELESQTVALTTPGHNMIVLSDSPDNCRIRMRTAGGMQAILDDTNERIYISTAGGNAWFEMDQDGHIHFFGAQSISMRSGVDVNIAADRYVNIQGKEGINIKSECCITLDSGNNIMNLAGGSIYQTATGSIANNAGGCILNTGSQIHLNSDDSQADMASGASGPSVIPSKEPWQRPASATKRNSNWKA